VGFLAFQINARRLRHAKSDRLALGIGSCGRRHRNGIISRRCAADGGLLLAAAAACWNKQRQRKQHTQCQEPKNLSTAAIPSNPHQSQPGNHEPECVETSRELARGSCRNGPRSRRYAQDHRGPTAVRQRHWTSARVATRRRRQIGAGNRNA